MKREKEFAALASFYSFLFPAFVIFVVVFLFGYMAIGLIVEENRVADARRIHASIGEIIQSIELFADSVGDFSASDSLLKKNIGNILQSDQIRVYIIQNIEEYISFIRQGNGSGFARFSPDSSVGIIDTFAGKTKNGEFVVVELYYTNNTVYKNLEFLQKIFLYGLFSGVILFFVLVLFFYRKRAGGFAVQNHSVGLTPQTEDDALLSGLNISSEIAFLNVSSGGKILSANPLCRKLLELPEKQVLQLSLKSVIALPEEIRRKLPRSYKTTYVTKIDIQSMTGSVTECQLEIHPYTVDAEVKAVTYLFIVLASPMASEKSSEILGFYWNTVAGSAKLDLVKSLIHDMNNYLSGIIGLASVEIERSSPTGAESSFEMIRDSAEKISVLCSDLQSTISGTGEQINRDLMGEMLFIAEVLRKIIPPRVEIEVTGESSIHTLEDRELIHEFFYGLALYSAGMMDGEGRIRLEVSEWAAVTGNSTDTVLPGSKVAIRYSDGYIMPVALRDIFSNKNYTTADVERQYGPTLGRAYRALTQISGSVIFERASGETILCLLLDSYYSEDIEAVSSKVAAEEKSSGISVLIADDVDVVLDSMAEYLEHCGIVTTRVGDGNQAMALLEKNNFDVVILDLSMPGTPTPAIVRYCQTSKPDMGIIITTGYNISDEVMDLVKHTSTDCIYKPHRPEALVNMIYSLLQTIRNRRAE